MFANDAVNGQLGAGRLAEPHDDRVMGDVVEHGLALEADHRERCPGARDVGRVLEVAAGLAGRGLTSRRCDG